MERKQPKQWVTIEQKPVERVEERPERRRLRLHTLETRVAPNALWGD
jgi:hypothetical protein